METGTAAKTDRARAAESEGRLDKRAATIRSMFAGVAPRYDLLNRLISGFMDEGWRRTAAAAVDRAPEGPILDLCSGTGDQARAVRRLGRGVTAADFTLAMLAIARRKLAPLERTAQRPMVAPVVADVLELPLADDTHAGGVVSFGLRNVADLDASLAEIARVVRPGGRLVVLEAAVPRKRLLRPLFLFYFRRLMPWLGKLLSPRGSAYEYLPASVIDFPDREAFLRRMADAGWTDLTYRDLSFGAVCIYEGRCTR
jgi:demethylmenaquinone methyltransferase/2-methoxy-6-polyprenyl-1,4-benzoquinol methylase